MNAPLSNFDNQSFGARAAITNRTHRIVREQAQMIHEQKTKSRGLWAPIAICSALLAVVLYASWGVLDGYNFVANASPVSTASGVLDASDQLALLMLWSLPVTAALLSTMWMRRDRKGSQE